jgi:hypothetical protein
MVSIHSLFKKKIKKIDDDLFIRRLRSSVLGEGMLIDGNIYLIDYAIRNIPVDGAIIEIGIYGGVSTNLICYLLLKYDKHNLFFNCDPWIYEGYEDKHKSPGLFIDGRTGILRTSFMEYVKTAYLNSVKLLNKRLPHTFHCKADAFFDLWRNQVKTTDIFNAGVTLGGGISFAYIDGDHSYETAKSDYLNILEYLVTGGFILFDDSHDALSFGSARLMREALENKDLELVMKNPNYLFRKIS